MYQLKKGVESFQVVDGDFAGKKFFRGDLYREKEIPPQEKHKFEKVQDAKVQGSKVQGSKVEKQKTPEPLNAEPGTATERSKT